MSVNRKVTVPVGESAMRLESSLPSHYSTVASPSEVEGIEVARRSNRPAKSLGGLGRQLLRSGVAARPEVVEDEAPDISLAGSPSRLGCGRVAEGVRLLRAGFATVGTACNRPSAEVDVE
jgi:hypothetical protein